MFIDKFTVVVKDLHSKKAKKIKLDADDAWDAHKQALSKCNQLTQDIVKITNANNELVYTIDDGFINI